MQDALARAMQGKTVLAIAHRLSTIAELDRIVPLLGTLLNTPADLLADLSLPLLLEREDLLPPVPGESETRPLEGGWEEEL